MLATPHCILPRPRIEQTLCKTYSREAQTYTRRIDAAPSRYTPPRLDCLARVVGIRLRKQRLSLV
jgi:hypothetical protein